MNGADRIVERRVILTAMLGILGLLGSPALAQGRPGAITGVVKDETGATIPYVEVVATKTSSTARTDSLGKFVLGRLPAGVLEINFRRVSFSPFITTIEVNAGDTTEVEVTLSPTPLPMATVVVKEDSSVLRRLVAFENHRRMGTGHFITRSDILKRGPLLLSDMVRMIPGTLLVPNGISGQSLLRFTRADKSCPPQYYIDGIYAVGYNIDDMPVIDVEAVELYAGIAGLPAEYAKTRNMRECGTVAIWTRIPGKK